MEPTKVTSRKVRPYRKYIRRIIKENGDIILVYTEKSTEYPFSTTVKMTTILSKR